MKWFKGNPGKKADGSGAEVPYNPSQSRTAVATPVPDRPSDPKSQGIADWGRKGDSEAVKELITLLLAESGAQYRQEIVKALKSCPSEEVLAGVVFALRLDDRHSRMAAAEAIGLFGDNRATEHLYMAATDRDPGVRAKAIESLGRLGDRSALKLMMQGLSDRSASVRIAAAEAIGRTGDPSAVNALISAMIEANTIARAPMADALGKIGDERAVGPLVDRLEDKGWDIHWAAAAALGRIGGVNAVGALLTWSKRIFSSDLKKISAAEKCQLVNEVMLELFRSLKNDHLQEVTPKVETRIIMRSWELLDAASVTEGWAEEVIENPVWLILQDEFGRRRLTPTREPRHTNPVITPSDEMTDPPPPAPAESNSPAMDGEPLTTEDVPLEELAISIEETPASNGHSASEEPVFKTPPVAGIAIDFLTFLAAKGIDDVVLTGETVCDIARGENPGILNVTCLVRQHRGAIPSTADPVAWNIAWNATAWPALERLGVALSTTPQDLINGKVQFTAEDRSLRVRYVGPYVIEDRKLTWRDSQVECRLNQVVSRSGLIAVGPRRQVFGLVSTAPVDRMWIDPELNWGGDIVRGLRDATEKVLVMDQPGSELGLVDVLRTLLIKHRCGFRLSGESAAFLERAAAAIRGNPDAARAQFSKKAFDRLMAAAPLESVVEELAVLDLHGVLMDILDAGNLHRLNESMLRRESERTRHLAEAQRALDETRKDLEATQKTFEEKQGQFTRIISQMSGPQETRLDIEQRLRAKIERLKQADEAARRSAQTLNEVTQQLQAVTAEKKVDRGLLQSHREALAAKREHDAELSELKKEVEQLRSVMDKKHESSFESQEQMEKLGKELEEATQAFDEAQSRAESAQTALDELKASLETTPARRRRILMELPAGR